MRKCENCGKVASSNNEVRCSACGGNFVEEEVMSCRNCGTPITPGSGFCKNCGVPVNPGYDHTVNMSGGASYVRESVPAESGDKNKIMIIAIAIVTAVCILAAAIVITVVLIDDDSSSVSSDDEEEVVSVNNEDDETKNKDDLNNQEEIQKQQELQKQEELKRQEELQKQEELKRQEELQKQEELKRQQELQKQEELKRQEELKKQQELEREKELQRQEDFQKLENTVDNYVNSFVNALNNGDSSYMVPYTMSGSNSSNVYSTQTKFIHSGVYEYEEYIDSYIVGQPKYENDNTCVIAVYEIYNVRKPGEDLKRHEQTVNYRMKRDAYGDWKVCDFVGSVKTH